MSIKEKPVQEAIDRLREAAVADAQSSTEESKSKLAWAELGLWEAIAAFARADVAAAVKHADARARADDSGIASGSFP